MKIYLLNKRLSLFVEILFLTLLLVISYFLYLKPVINSLGLYLFTGGADDSTYGIMAQKILRGGFKAAFNFTWPPLFPYFMATLNRHTYFSLEDSGRIIASLAICLNILPTYFLAKSLFNEKVGFLSAFFVTFFPMSNVWLGYARPQTLQVLFFSTGLLLSLLALKNKKLLLFFVSGSLWGLAYLNRFESWLPLLVLILLIILQIKSKASLFRSIVKITVLIIGFLIVTFPYLKYVRQYYGSWTLNPRIDMDITSETGGFSPIYDKHGLTNLIQIVGSFNTKYYQYDIFHPSPLKFLSHLGNFYMLDSPMFFMYLNILIKSSKEIVIFSLLGLLLILLSVLKKSIYKFSLILSIYSLIFAFTNILRVMFVNLSGVGDRKTLDFIQVLFYRSFIKNFNSYLGLNLSILILSLFTLFLNKRNYFKDIQTFINKYVLILFVPFSSFVCLFPLIMHSIDEWYVLWIWPVIFIYCSYFIVKSVTFLIGKLINSHSYLTKISSSTLLFLIIILSYRGFSRIYNNVIERSNNIYRPNSGDTNSYLMGLNYQNIGNKILEDHGPGASIVVISTPPIFYAQGNPDYFLTGGNISFIDSVHYLENNNFEYMVVVNNEINRYKDLMPLLNPMTKIDNWSVFYTQPSLETLKKDPGNIISNISFVIWKNNNLSKN